jgi:hypothetical protein
MRNPNLDNPNVKSALEPSAHKALEVITADLSCRLCLKEACWMHGMSR